MPASSGGVDGDIDESDDDYTDGIECIDPVEDFSQVVIPATHMLMKYGTHYLSFGSTHARWKCLTVYVRLILNVERVWSLFLFHVCLVCFSLCIFAECEVQWLLTVFDLF